MGCDGLTYTSMAEAFDEKGAKVYISWNGPVGATHTDLATIRLLQNLFTGGHTIKQAVAETMNEIGPDPAFESKLTFYPSEEEDYVVTKILSLSHLIGTEIRRHNPRKEK